MYITKKKLFYYIKNYFITINIIGILFIFMDFFHEIINYQTQILETSIKFKIFIKKAISIYYFLSIISLQVFFISLVFYIIFKERFFIYLKRFLMSFIIISLLLTSITYMAENDNYEYMIEEYKNNRVTHEKEVAMIKEYLSSEKKVKYEIFINKIFTSFYFLLYILVKIFAFILIIYLFFKFCKNIFLKIKSYFK